MREVIIEDSFWEDYERIMVFLKENTSESYLNKVKVEIDKSLEVISEHNDIAPLVDFDFDEPIRKYVRFHYLTFYVVLEKYVRILRIFHEKEDWINNI